MFYYKLFFYFKNLIWYFLKLNSSDETVSQSLDFLLKNFMIGYLLPSKSFVNIDDNDLHYEPFNFLARFYSFVWLILNKFLVEKLINFRVIFDRIIGKFSKYHAKKYYSNRPDISLKSIRLSIDNFRRHSSHSSQSCILTKLILIFYL